MDVLVSDNESVDAGKLKIEESSDFLVNAETFVSDEVMVVSVVDFGE